MAEFKPGSMDITEHEKTFAGFITLATRTTVLIIVVLIFLALTGT